MKFEAKLYNNYSSVTKRFNSFKEMTNWVIKIKNEYPDFKEYTYNVVNNT